MSLDVMKQVAQTEQNAQNRKAEASAGAKRMVAEAERAGRARLDEARAQAEAKVRELMAQAEQKAAAHTDEVLAQTRKSCDAMRAKAEGRLDEAAALIVRRVVNN